MSKVVAFLFLFSFSWCNAQGIEFLEGKWKDALVKAKKDDKLIFVDAYTKWCGPCKMMAKNIFTQQKVGEFFNANFINIKLDMEEEDGVAFGHKYPVSAYPTLLFIDGDGKLIKKVVGGQQAETLIAQGQDAIKKNDKSGQYEVKYLAGDRSYELMYNYVKALNAAGKPSLKISNEYLNSNPQITENQRMTFLLEAATEADSKLFDAVINNKSKIIAATGKSVFETKCKSACEATVKKAVEYEMETLLDETIEKAKKTFPDEADIFIAKANMEYYKAFRVESKYIDAYRLLAKKSDQNTDQLKFIVQDINKSFKQNQKMVADATQYAEQIYAKKNDVESLNLYCSMLLAGKDVDKAIKVVTTAKERAEKDGQDLAPYDGLLNYLQSKKT
jgi:thiol-disulfide isomerase/thioredoxin